MANLAVANVLYRRQDGGRRSRHSRLGGHREAPSGHGHGTLAVIERWLLRVGADVLFQPPDSSPILGV
ncbi:MAG TPA: hypothetical protein VKI41_08405, partial [Vicinamibacteria bacterium]|nr:hypothetical protein [Vicinamibacteria bacterium]